MRSNCTCSVRKASRTMGGVVWGDRSERFSSAQGRTCARTGSGYNWRNSSSSRTLESSSSATNAAVAPMVNPASKASPIGMAAGLDGELGGVALGQRGGIPGPLDRAEALLAQCELPRGVSVPGSVRRFERAAAA